MYVRIVDGEITAQVSWNDGLTAFIVCRDDRHGPVPGDLSALPPRAASHPAIPSSQV